MQSFASTSFYHFRQNIQEALPICVVFVDRLPPVTAGSQVVQRTGKFDSQRSGHAQGNVYARDGAPVLEAMRRFVEQVEGNPEHLLHRYLDPTIRLKGAPHEVVR